MSTTVSRKNPLQNVPWKTRLLMEFGSFLFRAAMRPNMTLNRRLLTLFDPKAAASSKPKNGVVSFDAAVDPSRNVWFRLYTTTSAKLPVIFFIHGGAYVFGAADSFGSDASCRRLSRQLSAAVVSVNYRLAPEHKFPSQLRDALDCLKYLDDHHRDDAFSCADVSRCFVAGESAGGNLAHHVALGAGELELKKVRVVGLVSIQPFFGGEERTESEIRLGRGALGLDSTDWCWRAVLPDGSDRDHPAVNVSGPNAVDISGRGYPDTLCFIGGLDSLKDWGRRYCEWLKKSGKKVEVVEYPNAIHGFMSVQCEPEYGMFIEEVKNFMQKQDMAK
ncbi:probable carboxylesterase 18 [Rosa rugosa]|uniref:probable carboxylesterase 18 n=1 Tax=Rosa rugosa TaxID=74645 RepID=UPI002B4120B1|nr:probable carboxylesterase 18 [Rosa rugosa]